MVRTAYAVIFAPEIESKRQALRARGVDNPVDVTGKYRPDVPWISMQFKEASLPLAYIPPNITECGPIVVSVADAEEQDPDLTAWLTRAPTLLVNLGSMVRYNAVTAGTMAKSFRPVLETTNIQFLWKLMTSVDEPDIPEEVFQPIQEYIQSGRVRIEKWLNADPTALLDTGHIVASVHHGGANCFFEAIR